MIESQVQVLRNNIIKEVETADDTKLEFIFSFIHNFNKERAKPKSICDFVIKTERGENPDEYVRELRDNDRL